MQQNTILLNNLITNAGWVGTASYNATTGNLTTTGKATLTLTVKEEDKSKCYKLQIANVSSVKNTSILRICFNSAKKEIFDVVCEKGEKDIIIDLKPAEFETIEVIAIDCNLTGLFLNGDTGTYTPATVNQNIITEVVKETVVSADVMMANNAWIQNLSVDTLETGFWQISPLNPAHKGQTGIFTRTYIRIVDQKQEYIWEQRNRDLLEDYVLTSADGTKTQVYWSAIKDHADAYKFFTITNPKMIYKDLTDAEVDEFKVKIFKIVGTPLVKMSEEFDKNGEPKILFGTTSDVTNGPYTMRKDATTFYQEWTKSTLKNYANGTFEYKSFVNTDKRIAGATVEFGNGRIRMISYDSSGGNYSTLAIDPSYFNASTPSTSGSGGMLGIENNSKEIRIGRAPFSTDYWGLEITGQGSVKSKLGTSIATNVQQLRNIGYGSALPSTGNKEGDIFIVI